MRLRSSRRAQDKLFRSSSSKCRKTVLLTTKNIDYNNEKDIPVGDLSANKSKGRLMQNPHKNHKPETYDDLKLDFSPKIFSSLESYLPTVVLTTSRDDKVKYMHNILLDYLPPGTRYRPRYREIYVFDPTTFFVPTFLKAINDNTEQSFRSIMSEPAPGIFTFEMLQPYFCELLVSE
ncbi:putative PKHD-type hydroxylase, partial [Mucuna pruriens]